MSAEPLTDRERALLELFRAPLFGGREPPDPEEVDALLAGAAYRRAHGPEHNVERGYSGPKAKQLGLYPDNQNARVSWEIGWDLEHEAAQRDADESEEQKKRIKAAGGRTAP